MQIKTLPPMQVLYFSTKTTLKGLDELAGKIPASLYAEATRLQLLVSGPQYWFYYGADGNPDNEFTLEIVLPVTGQASKESTYSIKQIEAFKCLSVIHEGSYDNLPKTYGEVMPKVFAEGFAMTDNKEVREMYLNIDFANEDNCRTEILIGIK